MLPHPADASFLYSNERVPSVQQPVSGGVLASAFDEEKVFMGDASITGSAPGSLRSSQIVIAYVLVVTYALVLY